MSIAQIKPNGFATQMKNENKTDDKMMVCMLGICLMLNSCYHRHNSHQQHAAMLEYSDRQLDSISFSTTHHYTNKYNFMVFKDSIHLMRQQPEELVSGLSVDSFSVKRTSFWL